VKSGFADCRNSLEKLPTVSPAGLSGFAAETPPPTLPLVHSTFSLAKLFRKIIVVQKIVIFAFYFILFMDYYISSSVIAQTTDCRSEISSSEEHALPF
jgi:hypothetical protein